MSEQTTIFPDTAAGRMAARYCLYFHVDPDEFDFDANDAIFHPDLLALWPKQDDDVRRETMRRERETGRAFKALAGVEEISPNEIDVFVEFRNERMFKIKLILEAEQPHRIVEDRWEQVYDFELTLRTATEADAHILSDIERRAPVVTEGVSVATDRGEDYFASARFMDDVTVVVAEIEGEPAGVAWGALHPAVVKGEIRKMWYFFHLRVAPEHQKKGVWGALNGRLSDIYRKPDQTWYGHFSLGNIAWKHVASQSIGPRPGMWRPGVLRARLQTEEVRGPQAGRPATLVDAEYVVGVLNTFHEREEMYLPYTTGSFTTRVSKDPSLYSWDEVWIGDGAVVGVWPVGDRVRTIMTKDGVTTESRPGYVLDYGFVPGAEEDFEALLRARAAWLAERGMDRMSILTSEGSPGVGVIRRLTDDVEQLVMNTSPPIPPPDDLPARGLYADHIFF